MNANFMVNQVHYYSKAIVIYRHYFKPVVFCNVTWLHLSNSRKAMSNLITTIYE